MAVDADPASDEVAEPTADYTGNDLKPTTAFGPGPHVGAGECVALCWWECSPSPSSVD